MSNFQVGQDIFYDRICCYLMTQSDAVRYSSARESPLAKIPHQSVCGQRFRCHDECASFAHPRVPYAVRPVLGHDIAGPGIARCSRSLEHCEPTFRSVRDVVVSRPDRGVDCRPVRPSDCHLHGRLTESEPEVDVSVVLVPPASTGRELLPLDVPARGHRHPRSQRPGRAQDEANPSIIVARHVSENFVGTGSVPNTASYN